jgi:hypothetical protein
MIKCFGIFISRAGFCMQTLRVFKSGRKVKLKKNLSKITIVLVGPKPLLNIA